MLFNLQYFITSICSVLVRPFLWLGCTLLDFVLWAFDQIDNEVAYYIVATIPAILGCLFIVISGLITLPFAAILVLTTRNLAPWEVDELCNVFLENVLNDEIKRHRVSKELIIT